MKTPCEGYRIKRGSVTALLKERRNVNRHIPQTINALERNRKARNEDKTKTGSKK
jgi:hypothetical protein